MQKEGVYLAREVLTSEPDYCIRQSYREKESDDFLRHRNIFNLGKNPEDYLVYIGDSGYYVGDEPAEALRPFVQGDPEEILEDLLWPFVDGEIRRKLEHFRERSKEVRQRKPGDRDMAAMEREIHVFDRRRLHYFWYGAIDQGRLYQMPLQLCRRLSGMSRDQKEQYFIGQERLLALDEVKEYLYTVFNLQQYFTETIARIMPQGLDQDKMGEYFVRELCSLNSDALFWKGMEQGDDLSPYLVRYVIRFFDTEFGRSSALDDYIRQFINSRRGHRFPEKKSGMNFSEASHIFAETPEKMKDMNKSQLTRLFRRKAKELHPDAGGEHQDFIKLVEAYEQLLRMK